MQPLSGIRVLDLSETLPGPYCTHLLGRLGAQVVKVERPGGDPLAALMPTLYDLYNGEKKRRTLDLKNKEDAEKLYELIDEGFDILVLSWRPGVAARLGLDAGYVLSRWPAAIHLGITGFGTGGAYEKSPAHDINVMAAAGILSRDDGRPLDPSLPFVDLATGTIAALSIVAHVFERSLTGIGAAIEVPMSDVAMSWSASRATYEPYLASAAEEAGVHAVFHGSDGVGIAVGAVEDHFWEALRLAIADPRLADSRFDSPAGRAQHRMELRRLLQETFGTRPAEDWVETLSALDIPTTLCRSFKESVDDPDLNRRNVIAVDRGIQVTFPALSERPGE